MLNRTCLFGPRLQGGMGNKEFGARVATAKRKAVLVAQKVGQLVGVILAEHVAVQKELADMQKAFPRACADVAAPMRC